MSSSPLNELEVRHLMAAQLRLSLRYLIAVAALLAGFPLVLANTDWFATRTLAGVPYEWLGIGAGFFPIFLVVGGRYVRAVERLEADLATTVPGSTGAVERQTHDRR